MVIWPFFLRAAKGTPPFNEGTQSFCKNFSKSGKDYFALCIYSDSNLTNHFDKEKRHPTTRLNHKSTLRLSAFYRFLHD
ncbi:hypothetical protein Scep_027667 [Stephania cephalantha]|uniref:Uncharacterized protein n=1 Tax=Stephania cephalantha TaxID=152367 RepID=A0AAP0E8D2_9MAGN